METIEELVPVRPAAGKSFPACVAEDHCRTTAYPWHEPKQGIPVPIADAAVWAMLNILLHAGSATQALPMLRHDVLTISFLEAVIARTSQGERFPPALAPSRFDALGVVLSHRKHGVQRLQEIASDLLWELEQPMFG